MIKRIDSPKDKQEITEKLLRGLPEWFGIETSIQDYVNESKDLEMFAYFVENSAVGFITPKATSNYAVSIHLMAIDRDFHRRGIGEKLFETAYKEAMDKGFLYYTVKTLDEKHSDLNYKKTRLFYESLGFVKLETFDTLWDASNPCLMMIKLIK